MASVTTYLLVSGPEDPDSVHGHPMIVESGFDLQQTFPAEEGLPAVRFATESALEEHESLMEPCRQLSQDFPEATIVVYEVEERFHQVEHLKSAVFVDGQPAGHVEHGSVLTVGS